MQAGLGAFVKRTARVTRFPTTQARRMSELRPREQKLLEEDPNLKAYSSTKDTVNLIKRIGDVLVLAVVAGSTYEIYYRVMERKAAQAEDNK